MSNSSREPRKILHLHYGKEGGAERFLVNLSQAFNERGVEQRFLIRPGRSWRDTLSSIGSVTEVYYPRVWPGRALLRYWVNRQVDQWQPDAVIAWMSKASTLLPTRGKAARFVRLGDYPRHVRHFADADCIITNAPDIASRLEKIGWRGPVRIISNFPRDGEISEDKPVFKFPEGTFILCAAGRFVGLKGFESLIRAMAKVSGTALCLVGDGDERVRYEAVAKELGVEDRLMMTGWVAKPMQWMAAADMVCVPSTHEPLGNVVLEAWQCGVPVLSTPSAGPSWLIDDGENGLLVPDFSVEAFAAGIRRAMQDAALRTRVVAGGHQKLEAHYSKAAIVDAYFDAIAAYKHS